LFFCGGGGGGGGGGAFRPSADVTVKWRSSRKYVNHFRIVKKVIFRAPILDVGALKERYAAMVL